MNKNWKQIWIRFAMVLMLAVAIPFQSFAGNARIAFSDPTAEVGSEFTVNVKFTCTTGEKIGKTVVMLSYDSSAMEFVGGEPDVSGGNGAIRVLGSVSGTSESASTLHFKALKAGSSKIQVTDYEGYDADEQLLDITQLGSSSVTINAGSTAASASTDASLSSLQISPGTLSPAFSADVDSYSASVSLDTEKLTVSAVPASDKATVALSGTELQDGENTVTCTVTAEDGSTTRTYTILVNRIEGGESLAEGGQTEETTAAENLEVLAELEASRTPLKIGIAALPADVAVPYGMKETSITIGETKVQGWVPDTQGSQPEYCIFYGVSENGTVGFYRYDLTDKTIQRYFEQSSEGNAQSLELQDVTTRYNALVDDYNMARMALIAVAVVAVILLILLLVSRRGKGNRSMQKNGYDSSDYDDQEEEPEKKSRKSGKEIHKGGHKPSKEERYMMGEEDEYEEDYGPEDDELEISDAEEYLPDPQKDADVQLDQVKKQLAASVAETDESAQSEKQEPAKDQAAEDDDFEVFDLDDEL
ncbi:hypothetical protein DXB18_12745 [Clostridium sp. OM02-18AC]|uniref:cadherin-like beta sandwich domain-containing protein n=1 Tax=Clostridium sp. OM02-18AC TaxID=2292311 RepID=UPI000E51806F|nr:cadherin-like beta sandwich domain-containing protein [Clostridium sp. OM02-18AC]RHV64007.1 hypothetical protein DXB18_12745 [Clostridium sp. OM02-18AC]